MWSVDFCEDNLQNVSGAEAAAEELQRHVKMIYAAAETMPVRFYRQRCIAACRPCHRQSLILRLNDELVTGESHAEVIDAALTRIAAKNAK